MCGTGWLKLLLVWPLRGLGTKEAQLARDHLEIGVTLCTCSIIYHSRALALYSCNYHTLP
jgi:hypothetical protein